MFVSHNTIHFFGKRLNVLNFSRKKYLNKKAQKIYRNNYNELMSGKKFACIQGEKYVIIGLHTQQEINKIIEITNLNIGSSFYTYLRNPTIDVSEKQENLKVIYVSYNGTQKFDNTVYYGVRGLEKCPKFLTKRPCDTCMKCVSDRMELPKKVINYLF